MAEIVGGLFGVTPESLMAQREAALAQQAQQYAQLSPMQAAQAGFYTAGNRLAGAAGGLLGAQDPEMMRIQQRQSMLQNLDLTSPESLKQGIQTAMQNKDYQLVSELTNRYEASAKAGLEARVQESVITKNLREKQAAGLDEKVFAALAAKATPASVKAAQDAGNDISLLQVPENVKVSTYGQILKDAGFTEGTPEFQKRMQDFAAAELESTRKGKGITNILGKTAGDVVSLRKDVQATTKPYQDQLDASTDAIDLAETAMKTNNFAAVSTLSRSLAKAAGEQQLSSKDIQAYGADPSLVGGVSDTLARLSSGRPTLDTLKKLKDLATILQDKAKSRLDLEEEQTRIVARASGNFTDAQIDSVFSRRPQNKPQKTSFGSLAEAEKANLPRGTIITINGRRAVVE